MEGHPIVTVPRDLSFHGTSSTTTKDEEEKQNAASKDGSSAGSEESSSGYPVYLTEDWDSGIGGGLWTTGLALGRYFATSQHFLEEFRSLRDSKREKRPTATANNGDHPSPVRVLELGSGNGFLAVCLVAAIAVAEVNEYQTKPSLESASILKALEDWPGIEVVVTDTAEHLHLMRTTIESNLKRILPEIWKHQTGNAPESASPDIAIEKIARVEEYLWGEDYDFGESIDETSQQQKQQSFDLIIGSDVAYRDHLHDPLISALDEFCVPQHTVALIGVTMNDTKPIFFEKLHQRGYKYEKLADYLLGDDFCTSSRQFGVFCISKS